MKRFFMKAMIIATIALRIFLDWMRFGSVPKIILIGIRSVRVIYFFMRGFRFLISTWVIGSWLHLLNKFINILFHNFIFFFFMILLLFIHFIRILYCFFKFYLIYIRFYLFLCIFNTCAPAQDSAELLRRLSGQLCFWINRWNPLKHNHWAKINHLFDIFMNLFIKLGPNSDTNGAYNRSIHINNSISFVLFGSKSFHGQWVWFYKNIHTLQLGVQYLIGGSQL